MEDGDLAMVWSESYKSALRPLAKGVFLDRAFWTTIVFQAGSGAGAPFSYCRFTAAGFATRSYSGLSSKRISCRHH